MNVKNVGTDIHMKTELRQYVLNQKLFDKELNEGDKGHDIVYIPKLSTVVVINN